MDGVAGLSPGIAIAGGHVTRDPLTEETLEYLGRTFAIHCITLNTGPPANVSLFAAPEPDAVYDLGGSRITYAEVIVDHIVMLQEYQFLGGHAVGASAHPIVRNEQENGETTVIDYWYFEARDLDCRLREPGQLSAWD